MHKARYRVGRQWPSRREQKVTESGGMVRDDVIQVAVTDSCLQARGVDRGVCGRRVRHRAVGVGLWWGECRGSDGLSRGIDVVARIGAGVDEIHLLQTGEMTYEVGMSSRQRILSDTFDMDDSAVPIQDIIRAEFKDFQGEFQHDSFVCSYLSAESQNSMEPDFLGLTSSAREEDIWAFNDEGRPILS